MTDEIARIRAAFGGDVKSFEYRLSSGRCQGYARLVSRGGDLHPSAAAIELVERATDLRRHGMQVFVGGGDEYLANSADDSDAIFALPGITPLDVIEFARTGNHNAPIWDTWDEQNAALKLTTDWSKLPGFNEDCARSAYLSRPHGRAPWKIVQTAIRTFFDDHPFRILFADSAGLLAVFERSPGRTEASRIAKAILHLNPEAVELISPEVESLRAEGILADGHSDPEADMADYIAATGQFKLWWD